MHADLGVSFAVLGMRHAFVTFSTSGHAANPFKLCLTAGPLSPRALRTRLPAPDALS